jgi:hypothetical protein
MDICRSVKVREALTCIAAEAHGDGHLQEREGERGPGERGPDERKGQDMPRYGVKIWIGPHG